MLSVDLIWTYEKREARKYLCYFCHTTRTLPLFVIRHRRNTTVYCLSFRVDSSLTGDTTAKLLRLLWFTTFQPCDLQAPSQIYPAIRVDSRVFEHQIFSLVGNSDKAIAITKSQFESLNCSFGNPGNKVNRLGVFPR